MKNSINEFINPKSMVTPGVAGSLMMFLANGICMQFPEMAFRYVAISLSFLLASVILSIKELQFFQRLAFWVVNSLIIFTVGVGSSNIAANMTAPPQQVGLIEALVPAAIAQDDASAAPEGSGLQEAAQPANQEEVVKLRLERQKLLEQVQRLKSEADKSAKKDEAATQQQNSQFFKRW